MLVGGLSMLAQQSLPIDPETKKISWQEKVAVDSVGSAELFERAKNWMAHFYKTDKFTPNDALNGKIGKTGTFTIQLSYDYKYKAEHTVSYALLVEVKEGRYRFTITDLSIYNSKTGPKTVQAFETAYAKMSSQNKGEAAAQVSKELNAVMEDLKKIMATGKIPKKEDW
jgi:hypothetical protein